MKEALAGLWSETCLAEPEGFEPSMQVLPTYSLSRGAPSATRSQLRRGEILPASSSGRCRLVVQVEGLVEGANRKLHVLLVDHHAGLDLARGDHLDVDALLAQHAEHAARHADVRTHADADDRHLADARVAHQIR